MIAFQLRKKCLTYRWKHTIGDMKKREGNASENVGEPLLPEDLPSSRRSSKRVVSRREDAQHEHHRGLRFARKTAVTQKHLDVCSPITPTSVKSKHVCDWSDFCEIVLFPHVWLILGRRGPGQSEVHAGFTSSTCMTRRNAHGAVLRRAFSFRKLVTGDITQNEPLHTHTEHEQPPCPLLSRAQLGNMVGFGALFSLVMTCFIPPCLHWKQSFDCRTASCVSPSGSLIPPRESI